MNHTKLELDKNEVQANGYHDNYRLMPVSRSLLWGSGGSKTESTMGDMVKFLKEELDLQNKTVQESQRNIENKTMTFFEMLSAEISGHNRQSLYRGLDYLSTLSS